MDMSHQLQRSLGQRVSQTISSVETEYLLDVQPGLWKVIAADDGSNVSRFVHGPTGIDAQKDSSGNWDWMLKDGLGSVREVVDDNLNSLYTAQYAPYGEVWDTTGTDQTIFGYTGEPTDANDLVHLRARYYNPSLAVFNSLDPLETPNRYAYVGGDPINMVDHSGNCARFNDSRPSNFREFTNCAEDVAILSGLGISLEVEQGLDPEKWTVERIGNVAKAVRGISQVLGGSTEQAIGNLEFMLARGNSSNPEPARTTSCSSVTLFLDSQRGTNYVHEVPLVVHELGHVLTLDSVGRTSGSEAIPSDPDDYQYRPVVLWDNIETQVLAAESNGRGWSNFDLRENKSPDPSEQVADMFMFHIMSFNDVRYGFGDSGARVTSNARSTFVNGGPILRGDGSIAIRADGSEIESAGVLEWANRATCSTTSAPNPTSFASYVTSINSVSNFCAIV
jgi:RHS repeat-associated protein